MRIGVLTFHSAHNYGAMLQAYAMRQYLKDIGFQSVDFMNYQPIEVKRQYSLNPFIYGFHPRLIYRRFLAIPKRFCQYIKFQSFLSRNLGCHCKCYSSDTKLQEEISKKSLIIYGSDQIWNLDLSGDNPIYYGCYASKKYKSIVYGGSFGKNSLSDKQKQYIDHYFQYFDSISVRESNSKLLLKECGYNVEHVCDPVFLLTTEAWDKLSNQSKLIIKDPYIIYYALKKDKELETSTLSLANKYNLPIFSIHPTCLKMGIGKQLINVGPIDFLWLIKNAEFVCTNSFHASSFSIIFKKKFVHHSYEVHQGRVQSLLDLINAEKYCVTDGKLAWYDFTHVDYSKMSHYVNDSKLFLSNYLQ